MRKTELGQKKGRVPLETIRCIRFLFRILKHPAPQISGPKSRGTYSRSFTRLTKPAFAYCLVAMMAKCGPHSAWSADGGSHGSVLMSHVWCEGPH